MLLKIFFAIIVIFGLHSFEWRNTPPINPIMLPMITSVILALTMISGL